MLARGGGGRGAGEGLQVRCQWAELWPGGRKGGRVKGPVSWWWQGAHEPCSSAVEGVQPLQHFACVRGWPSSQMKCEWEGLWLRGMEGEG